MDFVDGHLCYICFCYVIVCMNYTCDSIHPLYIGTRLFVFRKELEKLSLAHWDQDDEFAEDFDGMTLTLIPNPNPNPNPNPTSYDPGPNPTNP
jgi:hypothetical protein